MVRSVKMPITMDDIVHSEFDGRFVTTVFDGDCDNEVVRKVLRT